MKFCNSVTLILRSGMLFAAAFLFQQSCKAQVIELACPVGSSPVQALNTIDTANGQVRQNYCVNAAGVVTQNMGSGTPIAGIFNSSLDPPLFQNYTLTATGAQTAINLTATPIDTHSISWRPTGGTQVTDSFPYANGDLHTANANWVYQTGAFSITSNAAYASTSPAFATRSDGPSATAGEWAQVTLNPSGTSQQIGPCVRMSTVASTAYCVQLNNSAFQLAFVNAGTFNTLQTFAPAFMPSNMTIRLEAVGTTLKVYLNNVCASPCGVTDANIAIGSIGIYGLVTGTATGITNFQGGNIVCNVQLDSSPDGVNWTAGGAITNQSCTQPGSQATSVPQPTTTSTIFNFVRVNVTTLTAGSVNVIYSGRLAPAAQGGPNSVSNGQWVNAGEIVWAQVTATNIPAAIGAVNVQTWYRVLQPNGTIVSNGSAGTNLVCGFIASEGRGYGIVIPVSGWLQSVITQINTANFPQGTFYINDYLMTSMPVGGRTDSCGNVLSTTNPNGYMLTGGYVGSFYPVSFIGTTFTGGSPWSIPGFTTSVVPATPAAGAEVSFTFSANARTCVQSISMQLVTSATAANRVPAFILTVNGAPIVYSATTAQAASLTQIYSLSPGASAEAVTTGTTIYHIVPYNNGQMVCFNAGLATATFTTLTTAIQAGDQWTPKGIVVQVQNDNN